jgi:ATP synthase protein I
VVEKLSASVRPTFGSSRPHWVRKAILSLLAIQAVLTLMIAAGFYVYSGRYPTALAVIYGGAVAIVVSLMLAFRLARAARPGAGIAGLYLGALERFVFVLAATGAGIALIHLDPVALIAGFVGAELAYYIAAGVVRERN